MNIKEDVPVTTTTNAGAGLDSPKLPINPKNTLTRIKELIKKNKLSDENP